MEGNLSDTLSFVEMFEASEQATQSARLLSEKCRDYYDNKQLTDEEVQELKKRGQPPIVDNVIAGKVNWLLGQEVNRRTDPKAFPRTPQHEEGADAVTDAVRFVCDKAKWDKKKSEVWKDMLIQGYGGVEVIAVQGRNGVEIEVNQYPWDRLFYDPHSREEDFSDARYLGIVVWSDRKELERKYPGKKIDGAYQRNSFSDTFEDRPAYQVWGDKQRDRVRCVLLHYRDGNVWKYVKFVYGCILMEGQAPYVNQKRESVCPLIMQSAYVDRENNRYSEVAKLLDPQDEINKRRSKILHMANSRQTMASKGAVNSPAAVKRELARPDGHIEVTSEAVEDAARDGMRAFEIIPTSDMASSQFALLQESKQSIQNMGATEALQGSADGDSGRAVLAKQNGAMQALTPLNDKLSDFTQRVYVAMWLRIRQFWTEERWIRVTDDQRNARFVALNRPITVMEKLKDFPPEQVEAAAMKYGLSPGDPRLQRVVGVQNSIPELDVDIVMDEVPDMVTLEAETFEQLVNIDSARGGILPMELIIKASPLRSKVKQEIIEYFNGQNQGQSEAGQAQMAAQNEMMQAQLGEKQSKSMLNAANAQKALAQAQRDTLGL